MTLQELKALISEGGATFRNGSPVIHHDGYQVSVLYGTVEYDNTPDEHQALYEALYNLPDGGIWLNPDTNKIEVDLLTVHISSKQDALNLAKHFKQKAIFDWSTFDSIYL